MIVACSTITTRSTLAFVDVGLTVGTSPTGSTGARVVVHEVVACGPVATWVASTLVDVTITVCALPAGRTGAGVGVDLVSTTCAITAGTTSTFVNVDFAVLSAVTSSCTGTGASAACASSTARNSQARIG